MHFLTDRYDGYGVFASEKALQSVAAAVLPNSKIAAVGSAPKLCRELTDVQARESQQAHEINAHTQWLLTESHFIRKDFFKDVDTSSVEAYEKTIEPYRDYFREETIGHFDLPFKAMNPRSVLSKKQMPGRDTKSLDVFDDIIAYGIITIAIDEGEQRPVVVCQQAD